MALMTRLKNTDKVNEDDITKNLFSLQFESALNDEEKKLLHLRARSHAINVFQCAEATYFVEILREIRSMKSQLKNPNLRRTNKLLQDDKAKDPFLVGILGCGRLGSQIAHCLLTYGKMNPSELTISTRRPEILENLQHRGVECFQDNVRLVSSVHLLFVCVLPSQLATVANKIRDFLPPSVLIYIPTNGIPLRRLQQMLGTSNIVQPEYTWPADTTNRPWNYSISISCALERQDVVEKTCPVAGSTAENIIIVNPKLAEVFVFAAINMCTDLALTREETLTALHLCMFGDSDKQPLNDKLTLADFGGGERGDTLFPHFDLVQIHDSESHITEKLSASQDLRRAFVKRYWQVFEEYQIMKAYSLS